MTEELQIGDSSSEPATESVAASDIQIETIVLLGSPAAAETHAPATPRKIAVGKYHRALGAVSIRDAIRAVPIPPSPPAVAARRSKARAAGIGAAVGAGTGLLIGAFAINPPERGRLLYGRAGTMALTTAMGTAVGAVTGAIVAALR